MSHVIVIRPYENGDEKYFEDTVKSGVWAPMKNAFLSFMFKEIIFQAMVLIAAILFIFFGVPITICVVVIPGVIFFTYAAIYLSFLAKCSEVTKEMDNIYRFYMGNAFSCFWVAEVYELFSDSENPKNFHYNIMTTKQFHESKIDVTCQQKKIVGTVAVCKSHTLDKGAWMKLLFVAPKYQRKGIASFLIKTAVDFATDQGYSSISCVTSEHQDGGRELCIKKGFELKQTYHKSSMAPLAAIWMYEFIYQIKPDDNNYSGSYMKNR